MVANIDVNIAYQEVCHLADQNLIKLFAKCFGKECSISIYYHKLFAPVGLVLMEECFIYQRVHTVLQVLLKNGSIQC